jgi:hypothetical protein
LTHSFESTWFQPLNLKCDILVSKFAFKFNLYRYTTAGGVTINGVLFHVGHSSLPFGRAHPHVESS